MIYSLKCNFMNEYDLVIYLLVKNKNCLIYNTYCILTNK